MERERFLLKISGECFGLIGTEHDGGYDRVASNFIASEIVSIGDRFERAIMVGGGNIIRGTVLKEKMGLTPAVADHMGMLGTIANALALQDVLEREFGCKTELFSALAVESVVKPFDRREAIHALQEGKIVIFAAGTGNPFVSTDTAAVMRAAEVGTDLVLKGTKVDGIFDRDPQKDSQAVFIPKLSHEEYSQRFLKVLDSTAVTMARDREPRVKIIVFNILKAGNLRRVLISRDIGSEIG